MPVSLTSPLLTDLYQLTMLQGYLARGMQEIATFEFFVRELPEGRNFLVAAGLEQALEYLEGFAFSPEEIAWLAGTGRFREEVLEWLRTVRFTGSVWAVPEGTIVFQDEPLLRVVAPLPQAQLVESRLINLLHFQTLIASKAARCVLAAPGKLLVDFGMRRAHGAEAGLYAARAAWIAGFDGTATVSAGARFSIPIFGTMAHAFIEAHDSEMDAFRSFAHAQPGNVVLLIDTYDTERAAHKVVRLQQELAAEGITIQGVRIDSGDLERQARAVRAILDQGGCRHVTIFSSGSLDEYRLQALLQSGAPIDGFGVGTLLDTSADRPYLDCAYKLQEYAGTPRRKRSEGKATWPGRKQVWRQLRDGFFHHDILTVEGDPQPGRALMREVMRNGRRTDPPESLAVIRARLAEQLRALPTRLRSLSARQPYDVRISPALQALAREADRRVRD